MASWFKELSNSVQSVIPKFEEGGILQSLTLTTPELTAERQRIDAEEKRKERIRNMLAGMLPWETRDPDREILVEECREAILQLSRDKETFFGPFPLPPKKTKSDDECEEHVKEPTVPSKESLDKLEKLQPLPPLLENFEFMAHVGLIEAILAEDPNLVTIQSTLSGGGARERIFWKNYFFHCAYTRYEAGLSIDEIWSEEDRLSAPVAVPSTTLDGDEAEETITFNNEEDVDASIKHENTDVPSVPGVAPASGTSQPTTSRSESDYEMVDVDGNKTTVDPVLRNEEGTDAPLEEADYELDELEAEIARELED